MGVQAGLDRQRLLCQRRRTRRRIGSSFIRNASPICPYIVGGNVPESSFIVGSKREPILWSLLPAKSGPILIVQYLCEMVPQKTLTMFWSMPQLSDFMQIGPDLLQCALSVAKIFSLVDAEDCFNVTFNDQINYVVAKANKALGLIIHHASELRYSLCLKELYCCWSDLCWITLVLCGLRLEVPLCRDQRECWESLLVSQYVDFCMNIMHLCPLILCAVVCRAWWKSSSFLTSNIDDPSLLSSIPFYVPLRRFRDRPSIFIPSRRSVFGKNDQFFRASAAINLAHDMSLYSFRSRLSEALSKSRASKLRPVGCMWP